MSGIGKLGRELLAAPRAPRGAGRRPSGRSWTRGPAAKPAWGVAGLCLAVAVLELISALKLVAAQEIPSVFHVVGTLWSLLGQGAFWTLVWHTTWQAGAGLTIASVIAVPLGMAIGASDTLWHALRPTVEFLRPVPAVAIIPLVILLYGTGAKSAIVLVAFGTLFPMLLQSIYGRREVDPVALETARSFRLGWWRRTSRVVVPSALPYLATGIRLTSSGALMLAVTTELIVGSAGLGNAVAGAENAAAYDRMYALILAASLVGLLVNLLLEWGEARALAWHPSHREEVA